METEETGTGSAKHQTRVGGCQKGPKQDDRQGRDHAGAHHEDQPQDVDQLECPEPNQKEKDHDGPVLHQTVRRGGHQAFQPQVGPQPAGQNVVHEDQPGEP